jgi:bifunctional non-homologous end joining protein LigD
VTTEVEVEGRRFRLSNLDKVLWPEAGFTKGQMLDYYASVAPALLPHVSGRPMTLRRFPDGVEGGDWYQIQWPRGAPAWLPTREVTARRGGVWRFCVIDDLPSLLWAVNLAAIELHPFLASGERPDEPTAVVFDLDPGPPADIVDCCAVALRLRAELDELGLAAFPKTSGSVGLHAYVPLNAPHTYDDTKTFARGLARRLAAADPERVTERAQRAERAGRVLVDWLQNDPTRSTVAPYSLRGTAWPTVSAPVAWAEVEEAAAERRPELLTFDARLVLDRLDRLGDLFAPVLEVEQALPAP